MTRDRAVCEQCIAVISFSIITHDSRVMRTIRTLAEAGYRVQVVGFGEAPPEASQFVRLPAATRGWWNRIGMGLRNVPATLLPSAAVMMHELSWTHRAARNALCNLKPDIVHANDWPTLPAAVATKAACGARIVYDSHEFAIEEHAHQRRWTLLMRAHVAAIETHGVALTDRVVTVSKGIAEALAARYDLSTLPTVIRNVPDWEQQPFRATSRPRHLLFHGVLKEYRGIETIIDALPRLPDYSLTLRGEATAAYAASLAGAIRRAGVVDRVQIKPAVPREQVVQLANAADIGLFLGPVDTLHNRLALPNKVFEYVMAGLAVLVSPGDDLSRLVARHAFGRVVPQAPDALATLLATLSNPEVDAMKRAALAAAHELNWQVERQRLLTLYAGLAGSEPSHVSSVYRPCHDYSSC
jgi:glycosyltransferase involved in cell wall biosynthesis